MLRGVCALCGSRFRLAVKVVVHAYRGVEVAAVIVELNARLNAETSHKALEIVLLCRHAVAGGVVIALDVAVGKFCLRCDVKALRDVPFVAHFS